MSRSCRRRGVWVSNQSEATIVWPACRSFGAGRFDDLTVTHMQTLVVQATDYGVWGEELRISKADEALYRYGYQGQFAEKDEETGWNHFELREYDAVIGRWMVPDPYGVHWSPYVAMNNSPMNAVDPDGGCENGDCQDLTFMNGDQNLVNEINFYAELAAIGPNAIVAFRQDWSLLLSSIFSFNPKLGVRF